MSLQFSKKRSAFCAAFCFSAFLATSGCGHSTQYYIARGNELYAQGKYDDAALTYKKAIQKDANCGEAFYRLALADLKTNQQRDAYNALSRAVALVPNRDDIKIQFGDVLLAGYLSDPHRPKRLYDQLTKISQDLRTRQNSSFDALRFEGEIASIDGKLDDASAAFEAANRVRPFETNVVGPWVDVLFKKNDDTHAEALAHELMGKHSDYIPIYILLYKREMALGRTADAEAVLKLCLQKNPAKASVVVLLAEHYYKLHNIAGAASTLQALLDNHKDFPNGAIDAGDFYFRAGASEEAVRIYEQGLKANPKEKTLYQKKIVNALLQAGKREDALALLSKMLNEQPEADDVRALRAALLLKSAQAGRTDQATADLKQLAAKAPKNEMLAFELGQAYYAKGDLLSARSQFLLASQSPTLYVKATLALAGIAEQTGNYQETLRYTNEVLAADRQQPEARLLRARALIQSHDYQAAHLQLADLQKQFPQSSDVELQIATLNAVEGKYAEAQAIYENLHRQNNRDLRPMQGLVGVYIAQHQPSRAIDLLQASLHNDPDNLKLHLLLASAAAGTGRSDLGMEQYEWVLRQDPRNLSAYLQSASLLQAENKMEEALSRLEKAKPLAWNDAAALDRIAILEASAGAEKPALADFQRELVLNPNNPAALNNAAFLIAETGGDLNTAMRLIAEAQRQLPDNPGLSDTLGWIYTKHALNDSAVHIYEGLIKKHPSEPVYRYHYGCALLNSGRKAEAQRELQLALEGPLPADTVNKVKAALARTI